ncbi:MAG: DUF47 domain-containing protein [Atopobiaceae bacterium]|nr:DUF47 domain-containing protein [Atopobiaceae bacterium]
MSRVSRKEDQFYGMLKELADSIKAASEPFGKMVAGWPESISLIPKIDEYEAICDGHVSSIIDELNTSFITPFDREDLSDLALELDNIVDGMEDVAIRYELYDVGNMISEADEMNQLIVSAISEICEVIDLLPNFKKDPTIRTHLKMVTELEDAGDIVYRNAMARVFAEHGDPIHVIKWKSLLDNTENTLNCCKSVANIVQGIIMKNA